MSYGVLCTFDLKGASSADYRDAYAELEALGLRRAQGNSSGGQTVIPTTTVLGSYDGASAVSVGDHVRGKVQQAFAARGFRSEIFVVVGGQDWTWRSSAT